MNEGGQRRAGQPADDGRGHVLLRTLGIALTAHAGGRGRASPVVFKQRDGALRLALARRGRRCHFPVMSGCGRPSSPAGSVREHPCLNCGACCAAFRVSFYWAEAEVRGLPVSLTEKLNHWMSCMAGTNAAAPRCAALSGRIGEQVACGVYAQRPSPCREVEPGDGQCQRARAAYGLPALV